MTKQIFYADARMSRDVLANEWDKRIYLSSLAQARELLRAEVYAFCVLDDRIRLLCGGKDVKHRTVCRMLTTAIERYERETELIDEKNAFPQDTVVRVKVLRIEDEKDALSVLRYIHLTPLSEGYTICAEDFWWTSFRAYRGHYNWPLVNTAPVMRYISMNDARPAHALVEFHRKGEVLHNPLPDCLRRGEYETLALDTVAFPQGNINETFMLHG